jgi:hypothetical protein
MEKKKRGRLRRKGAGLVVSEPFFLSLSPTTIHVLCVAGTWFQTCNDDDGVVLLLVVLLLMDKMMKLWSPV